MNLNQYQTLICSLPRLPADFEQPHVPISRPRLENRRQMLDEQDVEMLKTLERFWRWEGARDDEKPQALYEKLVEMSPDPGVLECVNVLADIRMLTAAVRSRIMKKKIDVQVGRWGAHIVRNWEVPDFGLSLRFPWLTEFRNLLENRQYTKAERKVCRIAWQEMAKVADHHYFDLPAFISYIVRWDLIRQWAVRDHDRGLERFNTLVEEAIGDYAGQIE
ncbi:MAG: DUF2764 domain-containing protein [Desulfobulbaceae bacterium]|nr:DUF2764 domain-containing protein [Desulfobulbaceae bacterium]